MLASGTAGATRAGHCLRTIEATSAELDRSLARRRIVIETRQRLEPLESEST